MGVRLSSRASSADATEFPAGDTPDLTMPEHRETAVRAIIDRSTGILTELDQNVRYGTQENQTPKLAGMTGARKFGVGVTGLTGIAISLALSGCGDQQSRPPTAWHDVDACALVSAGEVAEIDNNTSAETVVRPERWREDYAVGCRWQAASRERFLGIEIRPAGPDTASTAGPFVRDITVAGHPGRVTEERSSTCTVLVDLGAKSVMIHVQPSVTKNRDASGNAASCDARLPLLTSIVERVDRA